MKRYDFDYPSNKTMENVEEILLDQMCDKLDTNIKESNIKSMVNDCYQNLVVYMENGIELDCEISLNITDGQWKATVWEFE